jgi:NAD(P)H-dependent FMN reductase
MSRIAIVNGSTRVGRFSEKPVTWLVSRLAQRPQIEVEVIDLRDYPLPFFDITSPARTQRNYPSAEIARFGEAIDRADGFIVLSPEYNHGYSGVVKNAMDHTFVEWRRKPVTFVGWGNVGGARAVEQLRTVSIEFEMAPLRHAVHILPDLMKVGREAAEPFDPELFASLDPQLTRVVDDLLWWVDALSTARNSPPVVT